MLACATHWYVSGLFTVPTVLVGGWSWWSSRRVGEADRDAPEGERTQPGGPGGPAATP